MAKTSSIASTLYRPTVADLESPEWATKQANAIDFTTKQSSKTNGNADTELNPGEKPGPRGCSEEVLTS